MSRLVVKIKTPLLLLKNVSFMQVKSFELRTVCCIRTNLKFLENSQSSIS